MAKTRQRLRELFDSLLAGPAGVAVVHSSLPNLLPPAQVEEDFLATVEHFIANGWTWIFPAFTFSFCEGKPFHLKKSRSETGVVADVMLARLPGAIRTRHPVYSFVAAGPKSGELAALPCGSCFGDDTPFRYFEENNALQIMLGCGIEYFTQCHRYEDVAKVPYRVHRDFSGLADWNDGRGMRRCTVDVLVRDWKLGCNTSWAAVVERLRGDGKIAEHRLWRGDVQAALTIDLKDAALSLLEKDRLALVVNREDVAEKLGLRTAHDKQKRLGVALLGSANTHLLRRAFEAELAALVTNRDWQIHAPSFGQLRREIRLDNSELARFQPEVSVFCDRLEDLAGQVSLDPSQAEALLAAVADQADAIADWAARNGGWLIIHRFAPLDAAAFGMEDLFTAANDIFKKRLGGLERVIWINPAALAAAAGEKAADGRLRYMGRFTLSERMSRLVAGHWAGYVVAMTGNSARVIVTDLDNTLWGGILGEDGAARLDIGGDYPGNAYRDFQLALKRLRERGMLLAVCSKNDPAAALAAMNSLDGMAIRTADLAAHRIGWRPKWEYVKEIAAELNVGLSSVLFIDDNPVERALMRQALPQVKVLELPVDTAGFTAALSSCPWLAQLPATAEDLLRAGNVEGRAKLEKEKARAVDLDAFYASLGLHVYLNPLADNNLARAEQLCQKTNQFNTTGKRYSRRDLRMLAKNGADVVVIGLRDKYSAQENVGVLVLRPDGDAAGEVDLFLLSCRVLGRGIEIPLVHWAISRAAARGWRRLDGMVVETDRNAPAQGIFADAGMKEQADGVWRIHPKEKYSPPEWLKLRDNVNAQAANGRAKSRRLNKNMRIIEVCAKVLGVDEDELERGGLDKTQGWDSMKHIELILALEKEFEHAIPSNGIMRLRTLADLAAAFSNDGERKNKNS